MIAAINVQKRIIEKAFNEFRNYLLSHFNDVEDDATLILRHNYTLVCPDHGKQVAYEFRCPKCPSGNGGYVFTTIPTQLRPIVAEPDLTPTEETV